MKAAGIKNVVLAAAAGAGSVLAHALGGWDAALKLLVAMMAADYLTGMVVAAVFKRSNKSQSGALDSRAGFVGLIRKCTILLLVWIGVMLDNAIGAGYVRTAICIFFIGNEGLSLLENVGLMGVPFPAFLKNMLEALKEQGDEPNTTKEDAE